MLAVKAGKDIWENPPPDRNRRREVQHANPCLTEFTHISADGLGLCKQSLRSLNQEGTSLGDLHAARHDIHESYSQLAL